MFLTCPVSQRIPKIFGNGKTERLCTMRFGICCSAIRKECAHYIVLTQSALVRDIPLAMFASYCKRALHTVNSSINYCVFNDNSRGGNVVKVHKYGCVPRASEISLHCYRSWATYMSRVFLLTFRIPNTTLYVQYVCAFT